MQSMKNIWFNGQFVPWEEAKIHLLCHTLHYGGGAFEGIRIYSTAQGPAIFRLQKHVDRLFYSSSVLKMKIPYDKSAITAAIIETVQKNNLSQGYIRPIIFYGYGSLGVNPKNVPVEVAIACWPWGAYLPHESVDIKTSSYIRIHPKSTVTDAKLCGHYLNSIIATLDIQGTHYHEALLLDNEGYIAEGPGENFFMVKAGTIYTPPLGNILAGITRETIISLAWDMGFNVVETNITLEEAYHADEAFFTGTAAEVTPIRSIDDEIICDGRIGEITRAIKTAYMDVVYGKNDRYQHYLTNIGEAAYA